MTNDKWAEMLETQKRLVARRPWKTNEGVRVTPFARIVNFTSEKM